jgi:aminopeptidase 2
MVSRHLGEDVFMQGIRHYLRKHAYGNTDTEDLWVSLSEASGIDVARQAGIWTKNAGHPFVTVTEDPRTRSIYVQQHRFLRTGDVKPEEDQVLYPVFLGLRTETGVREDLTLYKREESFQLANLDFYKLNADHSGFYRTLYTTERLRKLGEQARSGLLTVADRAGLISDAGALCEAGYQRTSGLLTLLKGFDSESEYQVWDEINLQLNALQRAWVFEDQAVNNAMKAFQRQLVRRKCHELGWKFTKKDSHIQQRFKSLMFDNAATAGDSKVRDAAFRMFDDFKRGDRQAIHPNLRESVFTTVLIYGGYSDYDAVMREAEMAQTTNERNEALRALGATRNPQLIQRTLDYALSNKVRSQDIWMPIRALREHKPGIEALWAWLRRNWVALSEKLPPSLGNLGMMVRLGTSSFTQEDQRRDVERWFGALSTKGFDMDLAQSLESIRTKELWTKRDRQDVIDWLKENKYM